MLNRTKLLLEYLAKNGNETYGNYMFNNFKIITEDKLLINKEDLLLKIKAPKSFCNVVNTIHGGCLSTIVDTATTLHLFASSDDFNKHVSVDMNIRFLKAGMLDDDLFILCKITKKGKRLAFLDCEIYNQNYELLVLGSHTKSFIPGQLDIKL